MGQAVIWSGRVIGAVALAAWWAWLGWCLSALEFGVVGALALVVVLLSAVAATVVTAGLWLGAKLPAEFSESKGRPTPMPVRMADALGLDRSLVALTDRTDVGPDDTGEVAWARRGLAVLTGRPGVPDPPIERRVREAAWAVVALDGVRRMMLIAALIVVLFSGRAPFADPPALAAVLLVAGVAGSSIGQWMMSSGRIRPGARLVWSMASVGAGLGDGRSRSGLPIRWATTMATMVALNLSVALRGLSDRWTHGLGPMDHDARVTAMALAIGYVGVGLLGLRALPRPELGFYGATQRLEEPATRRLALGCTMAIAMLGFVAGALPTGGPG